MDGIKDLLSSKKALLTLATSVAVVVLYAMGRISWEQAENVLRVVLPVYLAAQGIADAAERFGANASEGKADAASKMNGAVIGAASLVPIVLEHLKQGRTDGERYVSFFSGLSVDQLAALSTQLTPQQQDALRDLLGSLAEPGKAKAGSS